ncbi:hypothetical protein [Nocardiopsis composta]|uniref:Secreted protein n=1 Tax=Nocardiopsis composta TaxID=157465 RepID=A0A7W8QQ21_9ACTN|nr:hypothetical protein [Nocardiopsis composta]MBB5434522.1 hypothetical protein [Nocardiopsis composta]
MARRLLRTGAVAAAGALTVGLLAAEASAWAPERAPARGWLVEDPADAETSGTAWEQGGLRAADEEPEPTAALGGRAPGAPVAQAVFPPRALDRPVDEVAVAADVGGPAEDLLIEVRGERADGLWTEWRERADGPADEAGRVRLPAPVEKVQVRVGIGGEAARVGTVLSGVRLRPVGEPAERPETAVRERPYSARLFATRIGLAGASTANGHTVRTADHFVALPSRRALAPRGGGDYTVRVCTEGVERRCAYAPVWDVGPWNITDDHWNAQRESWTDLPHGLPQAQAAFLGGHNGGRDGFGRRVLNPAGIDLADGTFREALRLPTNAWVQVDYLWTAERTARARVATVSMADPVVVRSGPGFDHPSVGLAAHGAQVGVECLADGDRASGPGGAGTGTGWYRIGEGHYIPAAYTEGGEGAAGCAEPAP